MRPSDKKQGLFTDALYRQSYMDLNTLRMKLPQDAVVSLAREVLRRLADRSDETVVSREDILELSTALIENRRDHAVDIVEGHYRDGADVQAIYLGLLAPAAHVLGEWWVSDKITFADVTVGTGRIYAIMRSLLSRFPPKDLPEAKEAFFASVPEDTHTLGVKMAADLCRKQGWRIDLELGLDHDALIDRVVSSNHLLVGISAGSIQALPALARFVLALRVSQPSARILVAGNIVSEAGDSIELMHVDGMAADFEGAMARLDGLWHELSGAST